jgi:hypothetical protein
MSCRSQTNEQQARLRISKTGDRPRPVLLVLKSFYLLPPNFFPPTNETGTTSAVNDLFPENVQ